MLRNVGETYEQRRARHIEVWLQDLAQVGRVDDICTAWLVSLQGSEHLRARKALSDLPDTDTLQHRLTNAGEPELAAAFEFSVNIVEGKPPELQDAINFALATAAGRLYATRGHQQAGWLSSFIGSLNFSLWDDFADAAGTALSEGPDALEAHVRYLSSVVKQAIEEPSSVTQPDRTGHEFNSYVQEFQEQGDFQAVWNEPAITFLFRRSSDFEILRRADEQKFMQLVEALPHPHLILQCLTSRRLMTSRSTAALVRLLRLASSAVDQHGKWRNAGAPAVLLLKLITISLLIPESMSCQEASNGVHGEGDASEDLLIASELKEYSDLVNAVVEVFYAREDAGFLGHLWLEQVFRFPASEKRRSKRTKTIDRPCLLAHAIASRLVPMTEPLSWIQDIGVMDRTYRAASALTVGATGREREGVRLAALATNIISKSGQAMLAEHVLHDPAPALRRLPGFAVAQIPNFSCWFAACWAGLRLERERAWRADHAGGWPNAAECLVVWGIGALEAMEMDTEPKLREMQTAWLAIERVIREGRLVEPRIGKDIWGTAICKLFGIWPRLFAQNGASQTLPAGALKTHADGLAETLSPYLGVNKDFMQVISTLAQARVAPSELDAACHILGRDLHALIGRFLETRRRLSDTALWNQKWIASMQQLQRQLTSSKPARVE